MSLYTKYRPRDWNSVIGQDSISSILRTSLSQNRVGHAYIFTGSRGTGKTTSARIFAKGINCLDIKDGNPCHQCAHCVAFDEGNMLDCIEIDGASNNSVDDVRDLIEKARFEPNQWKYKIYIIDEVHMLSAGAFNALLKTLEEPPNHVIFILATTEINKVPETIRSRSLVFHFRKISKEDIVKRLEFVTKEEGVKASKEALEIIAQAARWALRDALTLTEQNIINGEIDTDYVKSTLSLVEKSLIDHIIVTIVEKNHDEMIRILDILRSQHTEIRNLFDQILSGLRDEMMKIFRTKNSTNTIEFVMYSDIFSIFESAYAHTTTIPDSELLIEITLMRAVMRDEKWEIKSSIQTIPAKQESSKWNKEISSSIPWWKEINSEILRRETVWVWPSPDTSNTFGEKNTENITPKWDKEIKTSPTLNQKSTEKTIKEDSETISEWQNKTPSAPFSYIRLLEEIKKIKSTLVLDLKTARFETKENSLTFIFSKSWHYNRANDPAMKTIITEQLEKMYGGTWKVECKLEASASHIEILDEVF